MGYVIEKPSRYVIEEEGGTPPKKPQPIDAFKTTEPLTGSLSDFVTGAVGGASRIGNTLINANTLPLRMAFPSVDEWNADREATLNQWRESQPQTGMGTVGDVGAQIAGTLGVPFAKVFGNGFTQGLINTGKNALAGGGTAAYLGQDVETGAGLGAALPVVLGGAGKVADATMNVGSAIKQAAYPTPGMIGRKAAGERADDVISALMANKSNVPGVNLNAGQASVPANSAEFAALQALAAKEAPSIYFGPAGNKGQQESARVAAVRGFGGTKDQLDLAIKNRTNTSGENYEEAFGEAIKRDPELRKLWKNPYFKDEVGEAWKISRSQGYSPKKDLTRFLHYVKEGLDARIQAATNPNAPAISNASKAAISDVKSSLVAWLGKKNPLYDEARLGHIEMSKPINQMKAGQELERALVAPATGTERAASFGTARRKAENTISKGSGNPRIQDLTTDQQKTINAIEEDFVRNAQYKELAASGVENMRKRIGAPELPATGIFKPMVSAARGWVNQALGTGHEKALQRLAPIMQNPQEMAKLMQQASPQERLALQKLLQEYASPTPLSVYLMNQQQPQNGLLGY